MEQSIQLNDVCFSYKPNIPILNEINLVINPGEFVGIVGPNGSGKSTLAKLLNGNLLPNSGNVFVNGLFTGQAENLPAIKRIVSVIQSDPENQLVTSTVFDEITFALQAQQLEEHEIIRRSEDVLDTFNLQHQRDTHPFYLSVGEQIRLLLAASLVRNPQIIVLDEVFSMLDSHTRYSTFHILGELRKKLGISIVLISHRLDDLIDAERIIVLVEGRVSAQGDVKTIFSKISIFHDWHIEIPLAYQILPDRFP